MSFRIITGADQKYFGLLADLLNSLGPLARHTAILDLGLTSDQIDLLRGRQVDVVRFQYPHAYKARDQVERDFPGFGAMLARPYLDRIFPAFDTLMWMDADTWVHDLSAIQDILNEARKHGIAAVPEVDRSYVKFTSAGKHTWQSEHNTYRRCFGADVAERMSLVPVINSGVWAASATSPLWPAWKRLLQEGLNRLDTIDDETRIVEQAAFNLAVETEGLKVGRFPATYNWMVCCAIPAWHVGKQALVDPNPPHDVIKIVHLSTHFISKPVALPLIGHARQGVHAHLGRDNIIKLREVIAASLR